MQNSQVNGIRGFSTMCWEHRMWARYQRYMVLMSQIVGKKGRELMKNKTPQLCFNYYWMYILVSKYHTLSSRNLSLLGDQSFQLCLTLVMPWTVAHQAPLSMGFSRQEYWSVLQFLPPILSLPNNKIKGSILL